MAMKYAICNETFQDWPFEKAFAYARSIGYAGIEIAPFTLAGPPAELGNDYRDTLRNQIKDAGLECVGLHWLLAKTTGFYLTTPDEAVRRITGERLADLAHLCADLEGTIMVLGSPLQRNLLPGVTHDQAMDFAADTIRRAMPVLEDCGVTLALEPLAPTEGDFLNTAALGIELAKKVDSPNCRLHLDVKAMSSEAEAIPEIILASARYLEHFHANDPNLRGPGFGAADFTPIFTALDEVRYAGWVSVEVFDYAPGPDRLARESIDYMRRVEAALG
jgi:sugar phosphate isomerase/epimerase